MTTPYSWQESYKAAVLETDWTKMPERIQVTESEMKERQRVLSDDHGGTLEERQAIEDAFSGLQVLRKEASEWWRRQCGQ